MTHATNLPMHDLLTSTPRAAIRMPHAPLRVTAPTQPVGDPELLPPDPAPTRPQDPTEPVHAPRPREPELPAIDPHDPGLPTPRIGESGGSVHCWLI